MTHSTPPPTTPEANSDSPRSQTRSGRVDYKALHSGINTNRRETASGPSRTVSLDINPSTPAESCMDIPNKREREREQRLLDDPLAILHSPLYVSCKRCDKKIKLSPKSTYDPSHWLKHRERCLRRGMNVVQKLKNDAMELHELSLNKEASTSASVLKKSSRRTKRARRDSSTPPLTPDHDEESDKSAKHVKEESPSPRLASPPQIKRFAPAPKVDLAFEEYLFRSRRRLTRELSPFDLDSSSLWSWAQLKAPVWVVATYPDYSEDHDVDGIMDNDASASA